MQSSKLPIEACESVIDSLAVLAHSPSYDDYDALQSIPTLYACALVCRDWVYRSQHHLFRQVELSTTRQADAFLDIVTCRPHKAQSVELPQSGHISLLHHPCSTQSLRPPGSLILQRLCRCLTPCLPPIHQHPSLPRFHHLPLINIPSLYLMTNRRV